MICFCSGTRVAAGSKKLPGYPSGTRVPAAALMQAAVAVWSYSLFYMCFHYLGTYINYILIICYFYTVLDSNKLLFSVTCNCNKLRLWSNCNEGYSLQFYNKPVKSSHLWLCALSELHICVILPSPVYYSSSCYVPGRIDVILLLTVLTIHNSLQQSKQKEMASQNRLRLKGHPLQTSLSWYSAWNITNMNYCIIRVKAVWRRYAIR